MVASLNTKPLQNNSRPSRSRGSSSSSNLGAPTGSSTGKGQNNLVNTVGGSQTIGPTRDAKTALVDPTQDAQFRSNQIALIGQLQNQANGTGPSIAQDQFRSAADRNIAQQSALAAGARGSGGALAQRQAGINAAGINQDTAAQSAILRSQEQINAQNQLGNVINQGRTGDQSIAGQNASLTNATNLANAGATNQARIAQAQANAQINSARIYGASSVGAAQAGAGGLAAAATINNQGAFARQAFGQISS